MTQDVIDSLDYSISAQRHAQHQCYSYLVIELAPSANGPLTAISSREVNVTAADSVATALGTPVLIAIPVRPLRELALENIL